MARDQPVTPPADPPPGLHPYAAGALVFGASASVLVVELVALRLLAPYLGLTLETSTLVIGIALSAIALGAWAGGRLADVLPPGRALGPLLAVSGAVVAVTPPAVRAAALTGNLLVLMLASSLAILIPGALLSAVTPMVTKLQLTTLSRTGTVVGRLSGVSTAGAIAGTLVTGFVLISRVPVSGIMIGHGVALTAGGAVAAWAACGLRRGAGPVLAVLLAPPLAGGAVAALPRSCDVETTYHCAVVRADPARASGRVLLLDGARHSYVDLADPTHLEYGYAKAVASAVDVAFPPGIPLRSHHLGAGGLTVPRYLDVVRPGSVSVVSEIDPGVVALDRQRLPVPPGAAIDVRVEDGRVGLRRLASGSQDLVVGDAFGGVSVPWHLTTREAVREVARVLGPDGTYVVNLLDYGPLAFARAEVATVAAVFRRVALATETDTLTGGPRAGGNLVVIATDQPVDAAAVGRRLAARTAGWSVITGDELRRWVGDAPTLTDDYAPVDQLLTPYPVR